MLLWKVFGGRWFRLNCWQILWGRLDPNSSLPFFERNPITEYWKQGAMRWHSPTGWCWCYDVWNCAQVELWQMPKDGNSTSNHVVPISIMINTRISEKHLTSLGSMPWFHWPWQQKDSKLKCILLQISGKKIESPSGIYSKHWKDPWWWHIPPISESHQLLYFAWIPCRSRRFCSNLRNSKANRLGC